MPVSSKEQSTGTENEYESAMSDGKDDITVVDVATRGTVQQPPTIGSQQNTRSLMPPHQKRALRLAFERAKLWQRRMLDPKRTFQVKLCKQLTAMALSSRRSQLDALILNHISLCCLQMMKIDHPVIRTADHEAD